MRGLVASALALALALLTADGAGPAPSAPTSLSATPLPVATGPVRSAAPNATGDEGPLKNRFASDGGGGGGDGIHFAASEDHRRPQEVLESQVHRDVSRGVASLALGLDRELTGLPARENLSSSPGRSSGVGAARGGGGGNDNARALATPRENIVFSPLSVAAVLALVLLGSGGRTFNEVADVLGLGGVGAGAGAGALTPERDAAVHQHFGHLLRRLQSRAAATDSSEALAAHAVFLQRGLALRARFRQVAQQAYGADVTPLDFEGAPVQAQAVVNSWVSEKTRGRIQDIMADPPPPGTRMALATALYFNGQWAQPFPRETTQKRAFYVDGDATGETLHVDMMANSADLLYANNSELHCQVLGLPYKGGDVVMYIALPHERGMAALRALESLLTLDNLERLIAGARLERDVIVVMPRMKLEYSASLRAPLERLGVRSLFTPAANLSQLLEPARGRPTLGGEEEAAGAAAGQQQQQLRDSMHFRQRRSLPDHTLGHVYHLEDPLFVDDVLHKVEMEVTEMGTVASAASLATVTRGPHLSVRADRPFLFFIRHQPTGLLLFWGTVVRPQPASTAG